MEKFWTMTDVDTTHTNSRSTKFSNVEKAIGAATTRIQSGQSKGVVIMESVLVVKPQLTPVLVVRIENNPNAMTPAPKADDLY